MAENHGTLLTKPDDKNQPTLQNWLSSIKNLLVSGAKFSFGRLTSIGVGFMLYTSALMINFHYLLINIHTKYSEKTNFSSILLSWHIGMVVGCIFCGFNRRTWPNRIANIVIGLILLASGSMICLKHFVWENRIILEYAARFLAGLCFGFIYITTLSHIADNVPKTMRGYVNTTFATISLIPGFVMSITHDVISIYPYLKTPDETKYIAVMMVIIVLALLSTLKPAPEPITCYLKTSNFDEARTVLEKLWNGIVEPFDIQNELDERVKYMAEDYSETSGLFRIFNEGNWKPLLLMLLLREINVLVCYVQEYYFDAFSLYYVFHFVALIASRYVLDTIGRKIYLVFCVFPGIFILFFMGLNESSDSQKQYVLALLIIFMIGIAAPMHTYSSEAFPLSKRNASLAFITSFEWIFEGAFRLLYLSPQIYSDAGAVINTVFYYLGALIFLSFIAFACLIWLFPETKCLSLRQCRANFNNFYSDRNVLAGQVELP